MGIDRGRKKAMDKQIYRQIERVRVRERKRKKGKERKINGKERYRQWDIW